jgi:hypothetical protein
VTAAARRLSAAFFTVALAGLLASGCVQYSGSTLAAKVRSWMGTSSFVGDNDGLIDDVARAHLAVKVGTALELRTVCAGFAADVGTAYGTLPTPSTSLTNTLNDADQAFFRAASLCSTAGSVRAPAVARAFSNMAVGLGDLSRAARELAALGIRWVPRR